MKLKLQHFGHLMRRVDSLEKTLMLGGVGGRRRRGWQEEMAGWHPWLDGHEFEQTPGVGDGQGGLTCCDSWGRKELDTTEWLNWTEVPDNLYFNFHSFLFPLIHPIPHTTANQLEIPHYSSFKISPVSNPVFPFSWQPSSGPSFTDLTNIHKASSTLIRTAHH